MIEVRKHFLMQSSNRLAISARHTPPISR